MKSISQLLSENENNAMLGMIDISSVLNQVTSRNEAYDLIKGFKKNELLKLAKDIKCYVSSSDNKQTIIEKIIESTIGVKLRNKAMSSVDVGYKIKK